MGGCPRSRLYVQVVPTAFVNTADFPGPICRRRVIWRFYVNSYSVRHSWVIPSSSPVSSACGECSCWLDFISTRLWKGALNQSLPRVKVLSSAHCKTRALQSNKEISNEAERCVNHCVSPLDPLHDVHLTDDIVRGMEPGTLSDLIAVPILVVWLYGTLVLAEKRSGYVIILLGSLLDWSSPSST